MPFLTVPSLVMTSLQKKASYSLNKPILRWLQQFRKPQTSYVTDKLVTLLPMSLIAISTSPTSANSTVASVPFAAMRVKMVRIGSTGGKFRKRQQTRCGGVLRKFVCRED